MGQSRSERVALFAANNLEKKTGARLANGHVSEEWGIAGMRAELSCGCKVIVRCKCRGRTNREDMHAMEEVRNFVDDSKMCS